jgi:hypothetical protein
MVQVIGCANDDEVRRTLSVERRGVIERVGNAVFIGQRAGFSEVAPADGDHLYPVSYLLKGWNMIAIGDVAATDDGCFE